MDNKYRYTNFKDSENYSLFKFIIDDQISLYFEKMKSSQNKEEIWELKKSVDTLIRFVNEIEIIATEEDIITQEN